MSKKLEIVRNERGELTNWYGFYVSKNAEEESVYLNFPPYEGRCIVELCNKNGIITQIDYTVFQDENFEKRSVIHSENKIWRYIYQECRKYVKKRKIFVDEYDVEYGKGSVAAGFSEDFRLQEEVDKEMMLEAYFAEQESRYE